jgi:hypothetical protein
LTTTLPLAIVVVVRNPDNEGGNDVRRLGVLVLCALALPVGSARAWTWPVDGQVLRGFDFDRAQPYAGGQHRGIDVSAALGAPVLAPAEGVVSFAGTVPGGGRTISIQTPSAKTVTLLHLGSLEVKRGSPVAEGSVVGAVGPSGDPELPAPHIYLGIRTTSDPQGYLDPLTFLPPHAADPSPAPERAAAVEPAPAVESPAAAPVPTSTPAAESASPAVANPPADPATAEESPAAEGARGSTADGSARARPRTVTRAGEPAAHVVVRAETASSSHVSANRQHRSHDAKPASGERPNGRTSRLAQDDAPPHDAHLDPVSASVSQAAHGRRSPTATIAVATFVALVLASLIAVRRRRVAGKVVRMMELSEPESAVARNDTEERSRRASVAVCVGPSAPRTRSGVRGTRGHLRAVPPPEGQPGADGERDRRARHAGDGGRGPRRRLAA